MTHRLTSASQGAWRVWIGVGAPILGLVLVTIMLAVAMFAGLAREQDRAFEDNSRRSVASAFAGGERALANTALEYASWNDAYAATQRWDAAWIERNIYSSVVDAMIMFRADGSVAYAWFDEPLGDEGDVLQAEIAATAAATPALRRLARASTAAETVAIAHAVSDDRLLMISLAPIAPEDDAERLAARGPQLYLAAVEMLDAEKLSGLGRTLGLQDFRLVAPGAATSGDVVSHLFTAADGTAAGRLEWRNIRPGSTAFQAKIWPVIIGLLVIGALAALIARLLVVRQIAAAADARAAIEASRAKSEFLARVSHELRTPLTAIIGYAEIVEEENDSPSAREDAGRIISAARHLSQLINDIIDQSRIDADRIKVNAEVLPVAGIVAEVQGLMRPLARASRVTLTASSDPIADYVFADHVRLRQCLLNIAGNAFKFAPGGEVTLRARRQPGEQPLIVFEISDTGIGIAADEIDDIFRPFGQANAMISRTYGGTGLGLSIARDLARCMGGDLTVVSTPGQGSTFSLSIPAATASALKAA